MTEQEIQNEFILESLDNLEELEDLIEEMPLAVNLKDSETVNDAFRHLHSLKGGAGFMGFLRIKDLSHSLEGILDPLRKGKITLTKEVKNLLFQGVDLLQSMLENPENRSFQIGPLVTSIQNFTASTQAPIPEPTPTPTPIAIDRDVHVLENILLELAGEQVEDPSPFFESAIQALDNLLDQAWGLGSDEILEVIDALKDYFAQITQPEHSNQGGLYCAQNVLESLRRAFHQEKDISFAELKATAAPLLKLIQKTLPELGDTVRLVPAEPKPMSETNLEPAGEPKPKSEADPHEAVKRVTQDELPTIIHGKPEEHPQTENIQATKPEQIQQQIQEPTNAALQASPGKSELRSTPNEQEISQPNLSTRYEPNMATPEDKALAAERVIHPTKEEKAAPTEQTSNIEETIRVKVSLLNKMMSLAGELVLVRNQQMQLVSNSNPALVSNTQKLDGVTSSLQECIMQTRMQPVGTLFNKFNRVVRDLSKSLGKKIHLEISGSEVELDKSIMEALSDPLTHMIRNACDHGVERPEVRFEAGKSEQGTVFLSAKHEGGQVIIEMRDDGKGIDAEAVKQVALKRGLKTQPELDQMSEKELQNLILLPGFSTATEISNVSGRGVGMDVVRSNIEKIGGSLILDSQPGLGTTVHLSLPLTLAIIPCLIIRVEKHSYAIPQVNLVELVTLYNEEVAGKIESARGKEVYRLRDQLLQMVRLGEVLAHDEPISDKEQQAITQRFHESQEALLQAARERKEQLRQSMTFAVLKAGSLRYGLIVDEVIGTEEVVVKSMHPYLKHLQCYAGATVMGDGRVAQILDVNGIAKHSGIDLTNDEADTRSKRALEIAESKLESILLFKYGPEELFALNLNMISRIERVNLENINRIGAREFITIDGISTRIIRLDDFIKVSGYEGGSNAFLVMSKHSEHSVGLLISRIQDSMEYEVTLNEDSLKEPGVLGSALIEEELTLFLDLMELAKMDLARSENALSQNQGATNGYKILLAEDAVFFQNLLTSSLKMAGYEISVVENGKEALAMLQSQHYDLLLTDLDMPEMNGSELIEAIRKDSKQAQTPVIALHHQLDAELEREMLNQGFNGFEVKMDRESLLEAITSQLKEREQASLPQKEVTQLV